MAKASTSLAKNDPIGDAISAVTAQAPVATESSIAAKAPQPRESATEPKKATGGEVNVPTLSPAPPVSLKRKLSLPRLQLQSYLHNAWDVTVEPGTTLKDVLATDYWTHVATQLKPQDELKVMSEDGTWYARLLVLSSDRLWAKVFLLEHHDLTKSYGDMPKTMREEYDITFSAMGKYTIVKRGQQGQPALKDGFSTRLDAEIWLDGHLKTINA